MNEQLVEKITTYIDQLSVGLGVAAEHVYGVMVRQLIVEGIVYSTLLLTLIIGLTIAVVKLAKLTIRNWEDVEYSDFHTSVTGAWVVGGIAYIIILLICAFNLPHELMKIGNPEYYVIREFLNVLGGGSK